MVSSLKAAISLFTVSLLFAGCFSLQPSKGKLSDRMNNAADTSSFSGNSRSNSDSDDRRAEDEREHWRHRERDHDYLGVRIVADLIEIELREREMEACACTLPAPAPIVDTKPSKKDSSQGWLSASGGGGVVGGPQTDGYPHGSLRYGVTDNRITEVSLEVNAGYSAGSPNAKLSHSINGISVLFADASVRYFLTSPHTFMGAYIFGGAGYGLQWWDYRDGGQDAVDGIDLFGGVGVNFVQTNRFRFGLEARPGFIIWMPKTMNGYDNDVFGAMAYIKIGPTLSVRF